MAENMIVRDGTMVLFLNDEQLDDFRRGKPVVIFLHTDKLKQVVLKYGNRPTGDNANVGDYVNAEIIDKRRNNNNN